MLSLLILPSMLSLLSMLILPSMLSMLILPSMLSMLSMLPLLSMLSVYGRAHARCRHHAVYAVGACSHGRPWCRQVET